MKIKTYEGVSLIEMLITIVILTVVILLASITLTTLIKTSAVTSARSTARQESEFVIELIRRNVRNSNASDVLLYNVDSRKFNETSGKVEGDVVQQSYVNPVAEGEIANEIHFRPYGYHRWICVGYYPLTTDSTKGYIVKSSFPDNNTPASCMDSLNQEYLQNAVILNSNEVYAKQFSLQQYLTPSGNLLITTSVEMTSIYEMSFAKTVKPTFYKQALISTQKLTWE